MAAGRQLDAARPPASSVRPATSLRRAIPQEKENPMPAPDKSDKKPSSPAPQPNKGPAKPMSPQPSAKPGGPSAKPPQPPPSRPK